MVESRPDSGMATFDETADKLVLYVTFAELLFKLLQNWDFKFSKWRVDDILDTVGSTWVPLLADE